MTTSTYIRPMRFGEIVGSIFRLYWKIFIPIIILNIIVNYATLSIGLFTGIFVGPVLMMASDAILGKRLNIWGNIKKGISPGLFFKIALLSVVYITFTLIVSVLILLLLAWVLIALGLDTNNQTIAAAGGAIWIGATLYIYLFLSAVWVFIPMIMLLEKKGLRASVKRSFQILWRNFGRVFLMALVVNLIVTVIAIVYSVATGQPDLTSWIEQGGNFAFILASIIGLNTLPYVFVYYEYRARKENFSEELLTQELGYQPIEEMMTA